MKPGITFISERTKQFRYVDDNEQKHFLTQCSEYRVAKSVKRGMPVSIYSVEEMEKDIRELNEKKLYIETSHIGRAVTTEFFESLDSGSVITLNMTEIPPEYDRVSWEFKKTSFTDYINAGIEYQVVQTTIQNREVFERTFPVTKSQTEGKDFLVIFKDETLQNQLIYIVNTSSLADICLLEIQSASTALYDGWIPPSQKIVDPDDEILLVTDEFISELDKGEKIVLNLASLPEGITSSTWEFKLTEDDSYKNIGCNYELTQTVIKDGRIEQSIILPVMAMKEGDSPATLIVIQNDSFNLYVISTSPTSDIAISSFSEDSFTSAPYNGWFPPSLIDKQEEENTAETAENIRESLKNVEIQINWITRIKNSKESYVVPSNIWRHNKVVGLALEPCIIDYEVASVDDLEPIHIQSTGTFYYDLPGNSNFTGKEFEYFPTDVVENFTYNKAVGKALFVKGDLDLEDNINGEVSILEEDTLLGFERTIHLGYVTDAPDQYNIQGQPDDNVIKVELQLNGDVRGPIDHTQFFLTVADSFSVKETDQIRVFAIGNEESSKFSFRVAFDSSKQSYDQSASFSSKQFFALRKLDGKTVLITFNRNSNLTASSIGDLILSSELYDIDKNFFKTSLSYGEIINEVVTFEPNWDDMESFKNNLHAAFSNAFSQIAERAIGIDPENDHAPTIEYNPRNLIITPYQYPGETFTENSFSLNLEADDASGYYEFYVSEEMKKLFLYSEQFNTGSVYNKGCAVIADNRIPERMNLIGLYNGKKWGKIYNPGDQCLFIKQGTFETSWRQAKENLMVPGTRYYLGQNGKITDEPGKYASHVVSVGVATYNDTIIVDATEDHVTHRGDLPVGHIKPSVNGHAEYGYVLADGITKYNKSYYYDLYDRLLSWYPEKSLKSYDENGNIEDEFFIIPKITFSESKKDQTETVNPEDQLSFSVAQIKWLVEGLYEHVKYEPFERFFGVFDENSNVDVCDITKLVAYGPIEEKFATNGLEFFDIKLFVDLNEDHALDDFEGPYDWTEVKEGLFTFNNTETFGYRWRVENNGSSVLLKSDLLGSNGIAYEAVYDSPPTLLKNLAYKIWIYRKEIYPRSFDISNVLNTVVTSSVLNNNLVPTGNAIIKFINESVTTKELTVGEQSNIRLRANKNSVEILNNETPLFTVNSSGIYFGGSELDNKIVNNQQLNDHINHGYYGDDEANDSNSSWQEIQANDASKLEGPHGLIQGYDGNIHASSVQGFFVQSQGGFTEDGAEQNPRVNGFNIDGFIPYVDLDKEINKSYFSIKGGFNSVNKFTEISSDSGSIVLYNKNDHTEEDTINITSLATIKAGSFFTEDGEIAVGSRISLKKLYYEDIHNFDNISINAQIVDGNKTYNPGQEMSDYIGSAMQALYELPLAVFKYNNQLTEENETVDDNNKPFIGVIIERLKAVRNVLDTVTDTSKYSRNYWHDKSYNYTADQARSISKYIKLLTDNRDTSVNIMTSVGTLLAAAKETQERLLAVEASTFGEDYKHIPGNRTPAPTLAPEVNNDPTVLGLNRLVRALCQEIFLTADPGTILPGTDDHKTSLSRVDAIDQSIHGVDAVNDDDTVGPVRILLKSDLGSTYPDDILYPEEDDGNYLETGVTADNFDGLNDAVNRISIKLNALTESVNGRDNINANPVRLDTIRNNVSSIFKDTFWVYYSDDNLDDGTNDNFISIGKKSRLDKLTEELYNCTVNYGDYISSNKKDVINGILSEDTDKTAEFSLSIPSIDVDNGDQDSQRGIEKYDSNWSIVDVILDTLGKEEIIRREYSVERFRNDIWDPDNAELDGNLYSQKKEFGNYSGKNLKNDVTIVGNVRSRINKSILNRIMFIETALDKIANRLSQGNGRNGFELLKSNVSTVNDLYEIKSIEEYLEILKEWSGVEYSPTESNFMYEDKDGKLITTSLKDSVNHLLSKYEDSWVGLYSAMKDYIDYNQKPENSDRKVSVYSDVMDLLKTVYGYYDENNSLVKFSHRSTLGENDENDRFLEGDSEPANIIEKLLNFLYTTHSRTEVGKHFDFEGTNTQNNSNLLQANRKNLFGPGEGKLESRIEEIEYTLKNLRHFIGQNDFNNIDNRYTGEFAYSEVENQQDDDISITSNESFFFNNEDAKNFNLSSKNLLGLLSSFISNVKSLRREYDDFVNVTKDKLIQSSINELKVDCDNASMTIDASNAKSLKAPSIVVLEIDNQTVPVDYTVDTFNVIKLKNGDFEYEIYESDSLEAWGGSIMVPSKGQKFYNNSAAFSKSDDKYITENFEILNDSNITWPNNSLVKLPVSIIKDNITVTGQIGSYIEDNLTLPEGLTYIGTFS